MLSGLKLERRNLGPDLVAGATFAIVNVPQGMANAVLATVSPVAGLYALMVAIPVGAIFTSSVFMNVSTTGAGFSPTSRSRSPIRARTSITCRWKNRTARA